MAVTLVDIVLAGALLVALVFLAVLLARRVALSRPAEQQGQTYLETISSRLDRIDDLSKRVGEISDLFLVPHTRGGIGETFLAEYLANWLPRGAYDLQYSFRNGQRADAVINVGGHLVAVDSKFPLESIRRSMQEGKKGVGADARRAVIRHVDDIASKYIQPAEGTLQFALMYIPSERVYHYLFVEQENQIMAEALRRSVVPVSPGTLFLYLQTIAYGLRGFSLPRSRRELADLAQQLRKEVADLSQVMQLAGNHLRNFQRAFEEGGARVERLDQAVRRITPDREPGRAEADGE
ncbi:DNA recombination protein RmuC [Salinispira pacifica]